MHIMNTPIFDELEFHTSYDWIAPVVLKCFEISLSYRHFPFITEDIQNAGARFDLLAIHEACYQFAVWYKENSQS